MSTSSSRSSNSSSPIDAYPVRIMLGLIASLSLMLAFVHLPLQSPTNRVGWQAQSSTDQILLSDVSHDEAPEDSPDRSPEEEGVSTRTDTSPPLTNFHLPSSDQSTRSASLQDSKPEAARSDSSQPSDDDVRSIATLGISDRKPQVVGGMGSLYLNINYPEKARAQHIEGRLTLEFTVEKDGSVTNVEVADSLHPLFGHPLCDSAAVKGIRSVQFVPAKSDGKLIPVRLRLPVKFQLQAASSPPLSQGTNP